MTKKQAVSRIDLLNAYRILFAQSNRVHLSNIQKLQKNTLRDAYKKLALENHPDRARILGQSQKNLETKFKKISNAYFILDGYMEGNTLLLETATPPPSTGRTTGSTTSFKGKYKSNKTKKKRTFSFKKQKKETFNSGGKSGTKARKPEQPRKTFNQNSSAFIRLPQTELLLAQYLYYCGHITLQSLLEALQWQRKQRPSFGQIALDWQIITKENIVTILKEKNYRELFGECAFRLGYINHFQYRAILAKQFNRQLPIGRYFIERGILKEDSMDKLHEDLAIFNKMMRMKKKKRAN